jgi:hypothetical protein
VDDGLYVITSCNFLEDKINSNSCVHVVNHVITGHVNLLKAFKMVDRNTKKLDRVIQLDRIDLAHLVAR